MTENWDSGHEWLWRRRRRLQRIAPLLLIAGLALGFAAGRASRHHSTVLMSTAGPVTAATPAASTASAGTNSASPNPPDANSDDRGLSMTANPGPSASPTLTVKDRPSRGAAHPTLTIVEFSDFQCPFCLRHERDVAPVLLATGSRFADKIRYVIKSFPLAAHPLARGAAESRSWDGQCRSPDSPAGPWPAR